MYMPIVDSADYITNIYEKDDGVSWDFSNKWLYMLEGTKQTWNEVIKIHGDDAL